MKLLVTRPQPDAEKTADLLRARGHDALVAPLLSIVAERETGTLELDGAQAFLVTSANGARALAAATVQRDLPVLAVGDASARAAKDAGFGTVESADGDVDGLAALVRSRLDPARGRLIHAAGTVTAGDLSGRLGDAGFEVTREVLYRAEQARALPADAAAALAAGDVDGILFYSPRTARTFVTLLADAELQDALAPVTAYCLSATVAEALPGATFACVRVAQEPTQESLLALLG